MKGKEYSTLCQSLISELINARKEAGFSQNELASKLKLPQSFISKIETGERRIDIVEFLMICRKLEINSTLILQNLSTKLDESKS